MRYPGGSTWFSTALAVVRQHPLTPSLGRSSDTLAAAFPAAAPASLRALSLGGNSGSAASRASGCPTGKRSAFASSLAAPACMSRSSGGSPASLQVAMFGDPAGAPVMILAAAA